MSDSDHNTATSSSPVNANALPVVGFSSSSRLDSDASSNSSTHSDSSTDSRGRGPQRRAKRPHVMARKTSSTMIVPRDHPGETPGHDSEEYPPDDARAMSPRRNSAETEAMGEASRASLRETARQAQLNLLEIAESIELVRASHNQLQRQNEMLQDYIGGLTRSMSKTQAKAKGKKK